MMDVRCSHCGAEYEIDDSSVGETFDCEVCGKRFILGATVVAREVARLKPATQSKKAKKKTLKTCFWLGFIIWFWGVLIAAIIGGTDGFLKALKGWLVSIAVLGGLYVLLAIIGTLLGW